MANNINKFKLKEQKHNFSQQINRTFGVEFEVGFQRDSNLIRLVIDNLSAFNDEFDNDFVNDAQGDPLRKKSLMAKYEFVKSHGRKHELVSLARLSGNSKTAFFNDWKYFFDNFLQIFYKCFEGYSGYESNLSHIFEPIMEKRGFGNWEIHSDSSIQDVAIGVEFVTPPMEYSSSSFQSITKFCDWIKNYAVVNDSTGLHCHVDAQDFLSNRNPQFIERIALALFQYQSLELVFDNLVMSHRQGNEAGYAKAGPDISDILSSYKKVIESQDADINNIIEQMQDGRYYKLNIHSLGKHGTLEFRQMHGTLNATLVKNWIMVCVNFVNMVISTENLFLDMFAELRNAISNAKESYPPEVASAAGIQDSDSNEAAFDKALSQNGFFTEYFPKEILKQQLRKAIFASFAELRSKLKIRIKEDPIKSMRQMESNNTTLKAFDEIEGCLMIVGEDIPIVYKPNQVGPSTPGGGADVSGGIGIWRANYTWEFDIHATMMELEKISKIQFLSNPGIYKTLFGYENRVGNNIITKIYNSIYNTFRYSALQGMVWVERQNDNDYNKINILATEKAIRKSGKYFIVTKFPGFRTKDDVIRKATYATMDKMTDMQKHVAKIPGVSKSRQLSQVAKQTQKRPLAEDYLDEI